MKFKLNVKEINKKLLSGILAVGFMAIVGATAVCAVSCKDSNDNSDNSTSSIVDSSVDTGSEMYFEVPNQELALGENLTLSPVNGGSGITWASTDSAVATVDENGKVTAWSVGETIIKATKGNELAMCRVVVIAARAEALLSLSLNKTSISLYNGGTFTISASVLNGSTEVDATVTYSSTDKNILTVDANGVITAKSAGKAYVKVVASYEGATVQEYVTVKVLSTGNNMVVNVPSVQLHKGDAYALSATVLNGTEILADNLAGVTYTVSDESVASIEDGKIVGKAKGNVTLTAVCEYNGEGFTYSVDIRVRETYTVQYVSDGVVLESYDVLDGEVFANALGTPVKGGYRFVYWTYQGDEYTFTNTVDKSIRLNALWNPYDFTQSNYGAYVYNLYLSNDDGSLKEEINKVSEGAVTTEKDGLKFILGLENGRQLLYLPRMNYSEYTSISFEWSVDGWAQFGQGGDLWFYQQGMLLEGIITIYYMGDGQTLYLEASGNNGVFGKYIVDAEIATGVKSLPMEAHSYVPGRSFYMGPVFCSNEEIPTAVSVDNITVLAKEYTVEGAYQGGWEFAVSQAVTNWAITLPSLDYTLYRSVTYNFKGSGAWLAIGLLGENGKADAEFSPEADDPFFTDSQQDATPFDGTITISYNTSNGKYFVTIHDSVTNLTLEEELTDTDVIEGEKGFSFLLKTYAQYRTFIVGPAQTVDL